MQIVSACLIGCKCRYDQGACLDETIENLLKEGKAIPVCPEQMGGLPTPRPPAEIIGGDGFDVWEGRAKVVDNTGRDVTEEFKSGALQALQLARTAGAVSAILKENSPSCGSSNVYDGTFTGRKKAGVGVTAALLIKNGINVRSEMSRSE
ncbi:hypothetical protein I532_10407 [Brevibacillus borstelensis AK1]|uniref:Uncharacterized protein n=1 Tax=Brevibacillus borstelensis AK1 TaxID=1300222 RepID=M8DI11_9BACL|nr:DUF523 domain-containing protein [Brevibacillus borstelensis]EMT53183.1 hypothetical protein I532_10407 [Brevibacillus borstelensis AK1]KKX55431.1 hypothetical protein X546_07020 [Brevibacillus borstelensis cifa_chp40]MED1872595.1 DUF523 domain-containing protein [Brevibacillus borstelensis]MED2007715.1 DUF523 domain-containing protein [Brevibacillus borstelensis]